MAKWMRFAIKDLNLFKFWRNCDQVHIGKQINIFAARNVGNQWNIKISKMKN